MKQILVPTDFSACANNAAELAFRFARQFNSNVYLYSRIDIPDNWGSLSEEKQNTFPEAQQTIHNTEVLFKAYIDQNPDVIIKTFYSGGNMFKNIEAIVQDNAIDFVVMGSHGASGKNEFFLGSNTQKVVRQLHLPILIVKEPIKRFPFRKAIFASNFNKNEEPAFRKFLQLSSYLQIEEIHLLCIHTSSLFDPPYTLSMEAMKDFKDIAKDIECEVHLHYNFSVDRGIRQFGQELEADLLVISNHNRSPLKRMLIGSNVEALVNHADLPVLSIDFVV
jgi:nucleotide-binding universal stress UspA family protein